MTLIALAIAAAVALLQTTLLSGLGLFGAQPDLVLLVLTWLAHYKGVRRTQAGAFAVGALEDILGLAPLGYHAVVRLCHSAFIGLSHGNVRPDGLLGTMLMTLIALIVRDVSAGALLLVGGQADALSGFFTATSLAGAGLTIALSPVVTFIFGRLARRFGRETRS